MDMERQTTTSFYDPETPSHERTDTSTTSTQDQFDLEVDASGFAVGAVLLQKKEDGKRHPVGYYSATLNEAERNYDIYNLELLAIVKALRNWRPLLAGSPHDI
jgi:hypothetical protein